MSDEWDFYFARVNDVVSSIYVDVGIRRSVPIPDRPWLLWVWVHFNAPRDDGLYSSEEAPKLFEIEDALVGQVGTRCLAHFVGRITGAGRREFYFYGARSVELEQAVQKALSGFPDYRFELGHQLDPEWQQYLNVLYPTPQDWQCIRNRHVLEQLERHGDVHAIPRRIDHWAYFETPEGRARFAERIAGHGFAVEEELHLEGDDRKLPYGLRFAREDPVEWEAINAVTLSLFEWAEEAGGEYDGWEAPVTRSA